MTPGGPERPPQTSTTHPVFQAANVRHASGCWQETRSLPVFAIKNANATVRRATYEQTPLTLSAAELVRVRMFHIKRRIHAHGDTYVPHARKHEMA